MVKVKLFANLREAANGRRIGRARVSRTWNDGWVYRFAAE